MGPFGSDIKVSNFISEGVPVLSGANVRSERVADTFTNFVSDKKAKELKKAVARRGDVVVTHRGTLGQISYIPHDSMFDRYVISQSQFRVRFTPRVSPAWVVLYFHSARGSERLLEGKGHTGVPAIAQPTKTFRSLYIPLPPVEEQKAIATALSDADALIESLEQLLAKKRQIKQGAMQELLTAQRRLPGFVGEWKSGCVGDVIAGLLTGVSVNSTEQDSFSEVPSVLKTSALSSGKFRPAESKPIVNADLHRARCQPRRDSLLISRMNTPDLVGEVAYVEQDYDWLYLPDRIWMAKPRSSEIVCVRWLSYVLCSPEYKARIGDAATGTSGSMKNIAKSAFLGLSIQYPEVTEQTAIAQALSDMDADIAAVETRLTKARAIKQGMMQELLTGRIRLV